MKKEGADSIITALNDDIVVEIGKQPFDTTPALRLTDRNYKIQRRPDASTIQFWQWTTHLIKKFPPSRHYGVFHEFGGDTDSPTISLVISASDAFMSGFDRSRAMSPRAFDERLIDRYFEEINNTLYHSKITLELTSDPLGVKTCSTTSGLSHHDDRSPHRF